MTRSSISPPLQLALIFLLFGIIWIIITDVLLLNVAHNNLDMLAKVQTYKGVLFMIISAVLIFFVSRMLLRRQYGLQEELSSERSRYKNQLAMEVFNAQEQERKNIGEELHDNINQMLGVVKLYIEHARMDPAARDEMLTKSADFIKQVINEIRTLSKVLVSPTLSDIGLVDAIKELVESILRIKNIEIDVTNKGLPEDRLNATQKLMIYRITQEQLNNILKHSKAEHVDILLSYDNNRATLVIEDDGIGFDQSLATKGLGLKNIRRRLELFNGSMVIDTAPDEGCRLKVNFEL